MASNNMNTNNKAIQCAFCKLKYSRSDGLGRHLESKHSDFLELRMEDECISKRDARIKTVKELCNKKSVPGPIFNKYMKMHKLIPYLYCKSVHGIAQSSSSKFNINSSDKSSLNVEVESVEVNDKNDAVGNMREMDDNSELVDNLNEVDDVELSDHVGSDDNEELSNILVDAAEGQNTEIEAMNDPILNDVGNNLTDRNGINDMLGNKNDVRVVNENTSNTVRSNIKQSTLNFACRKCESIDHCYKSGRDVLLGILDKGIQEQCLCLSKTNCCCSNKLGEIKVKLDMGRENILSNDDDSESILENNFFKSIDSNEERYFCKVCCMFSSKIEIRHRGNDDWVQKGKFFNSVIGMRHEMRRHLTSRQHSQSLEHSKRKTATFVKDNYIEKCNENFCMAGMFCAIHTESTRFYPDLCEFIDKIGRNVDESFLHPLGNKYQHKMGIQHAQKACFSSLRAEKKLCFDKVSPITQLKPRIMVAADKGTMHNDASRQVIVATSLDDKGLPRETLITASGVTDASAVGTAAHFKKEASEIFNTKNVCAICTDGVSYYTGHKNGMVSLLKKDPDFKSNLVFLPDLCHKTELLFDADPPKWLLDTIANTKIIVSFINSTSVLGQGLTKYSKLSGKDYVIMPTVPETRFTEYLHIRLQSVLKNLDILNDFIPHVIESSEYKNSVRADALRIMQYISNIEYVASLYLLDDVYLQVAKIEKEAQSEHFGMIDYIRIVNKLKSVLECNMQKDYRNVKEMIATGVVRLSYTVGKKCRKVEYSTKDIQDKIRKDLRENVKTNECNIIGELKGWLQSVLNRFDDYLGVSDIFSYSAKVFSNKSTFDEKLDFFTKFFSSVNTEFKPCSNTCSGIENCICVKNELVRFLNHFNHQSSDKTLNDKISFYLNQGNINVVSELNIINVSRFLEVCQLLKPSQSSTERVMSFLKKVVEGHYENIYKWGKMPKSEVDMVDVITQVGYRTSIHKLDVKSAARFLKDEQKIDVVWKNKNLNAKIKL